MHARCLALAALLAAAVAPCAAAEGAPAQSVLASPPHYEVTDRIAGPDGGWDYASIDAANGKLYVARADALMAVDLARRQVTGKLAAAQRGHAVLPIDGGRTIVQTNGESGVARFISTADGTVLAQVPTGKKPDAAFFDPQTGLVAVMNADDGTIALLNPKTRTLAGHITVGGGLEAGVADGHGGAYVNVEDAGTIARVDLIHRRRTGTIALPGCEGPTGLALVAKGRRLITACANHVALVVDPISGQTLAKLPIGAGPDAVLVDEARGLAFIPCGGSGTLIAVAVDDADHIRVVEMIPTQVSARTGAIDPRDGKIYLPSAKLGAPEPGAKRGKPIPGTFAILVVSPRG